MKISSKTETKFAQAVALAQNGKMKSTVHISGKDMYILNMDSTILLHFTIPEKFDEAVSFFANDYESPEIELEDGKIVFHSTSGGYKRKKACAVPDMIFSDVKALVDKYEENVDFPLSINKDILGALDDNLSHVELHNEKGFKIIQKDIYSGARIEVTKKGGASFLQNKVPKGFEPLGLRTMDFKSLFTFVNDLTFYLQPGKKNWMYFQDTSGTLRGYLATCLYDELGYIAEAK